MSRNVVCALLLMSLGTLLAGPIHQFKKPIETWTLEETVAILNRSAWARQQTYTRVVGGIGSGVFGEKELYSTFFVRFLSAPPIRLALLRLVQLGSGFDALEESKKKEFAAGLNRLEQPSRKWIVVTVSFRSNDPDTERTMRRFFQSQTLETVKNRVYLSTISHPNLQISAYFPPRSDGLGARFVFPSELESKPVVVAQDKSLSFQLDVPNLSSDLVVSFPVSEMVVDGELLL